MTTGEDGTYAFEDLDAGSYEVVSVGPEGWVLTTASPIQVVLDADDAVFNEASFGWMEEVVGRTAIITGMVWNDLNGDGMVDDGEPGVEGIKVNLTGDCHGRGDHPRRRRHLRVHRTCSRYLRSGQRRPRGLGPDDRRSPISVVLDSR